MELRRKFRCSKPLFELGQMYFNPHCDFVRFRVSVTVYNEVSSLQTSFHATQHVHKGEDLLMLQTLIQLYKPKAEGEKRGRNMPKVNRQVRAEVEQRLLFPSSLDSTLTVASQGLSAQCAVGLGFYVRVWFEGSTYFSQQQPMNKRTKETLEGPL